MGRAYFKDQSLISGTGRIQALWAVERALIVKHRSTEVELSRPVHCPVPCQVVLPLQGARCQVAGGDLHFLNSDAARPHRYGDHGVVLWKRERELIYPLKSSQQIRLTVSHTELKHILSLMIIIKLIFENQDFLLL